MIKINMNFMKTTVFWHLINEAFIDHFLTSLMVPVNGFTA